MPRLFFLFVVVVTAIACHSGAAPGERSVANEETCDDRDVDCPEGLKICPDPSCEADCYCVDRTCEQLDDSTCGEALECEWIPAEAACDCECGECPEGADCTKYCSANGDSDDCCDRCIPAADR